MNTLPNTSKRLKKKSVLLKISLQIRGVLEKYIVCLWLAKKENKIKYGGGKEKITEDKLPVFLFHYIFFLRENGVGRHDVVSGYCFQLQMKWADDNFWNGIMYLWCKEMSATCRTWCLNERRRVNICAKGFAKKQTFSFDHSRNLHLYFIRFSISMTVHTTTHLYILLIYVIYIDTTI